MQGRPDVRAPIEKHVAQLERRYGRMTACRVVLKGPGGHHLTGGLYEINIHLALPDGREVSVGRTSGGRAQCRSFLCHQRCLQACAATAAGPCPPFAGAGETARKSTDRDRQNHRSVRRVRIQSVSSSGRRTRSAVCLLVIDVPGFTVTTTKSRSFCNRRRSMPRGLCATTVNFQR
jgi:hypothetical protein